jgi:HPt (histidine-containing phosphotransfer) domain-containing protein
VAHTLKGSTAYLGATAASAAAQRLELIGKAGDLAAAPAALQGLEGDIQRLLAALQEVAAQPTAA